MLRNWIELLSPIELEEIHATSLKLLATIGIQFPSQHALSVFEAHGFSTNGTTVFFTEKQVMNAVNLAPSSFTIHARNPKNNVTVGGTAPVFAPAYGAPFLMDPLLGKRIPTMEDYHSLSKLAHALPNQDLSGHLMVDVSNNPNENTCLNMIQANIIHSDKPFMGSMAGASGAHHTLQMASILFEQPIDSYPVTIGLANSLSPLCYGTDIIEACIAYARARQPIIFSVLIMAGATGPITLAGVLAQQNAEILAGITLAQLVNPGTPVIYGSASTNMDMKTGMLAIGSPEMAQIATGAAQLARFYNLPSRGGGALTDAATLDAQAGYESMFGLLAAVNSGVDFVLHAAGILGSFLAFSYEKFVMDDELCGLVRRFRQGFAVSPDTLAYNVIADVGHAGHFLLASHTYERCHTEFWQPQISYRQGIDTWLDDGRPDTTQHATNRWQQLLEQHTDPPLDPIIRRQLETYVENNATGRFVTVPHQQTM